MSDVDRVSETERLEHLRYVLCDVLTHELSLALPMHILLLRDLLVYTHHPRLRIQAYINFGHSVHHHTQAAQTHYCQSHHRHYSAETGLHRC